MYVALCILVFVAAYALNTTFISIFYHRGLAHGAITLSRPVRWAVVRLGNWLTGLDPKGWVCMHRLHHQHSDLEKDPHSPQKYGIFPLLLAQLRSYERILIGISRREEPYASTVRDLDFDISWLNRKRVWWLPYVVHLVLAVGLGLAFGWWLLGAAYYFGLMCHPITGWAVNSFGHAMGGRNFDTPDDSRNNHVVAWLVFGEGYQNNHHRFPASAKFSYRWYELDYGYWVCLTLDLVRLVRIDRTRLIPTPGLVPAPG
jgi:fatty-acid desaturase